jgi:hypothetical protein
MYLAEQEQHITGKMSKGAIAAFIFAPAPINLPPIEHQSLLVPGSLWMLDRQGISFLFKASNLFLQLVNLSAGTGLPAIEAAGIQKERPADLRAGFIYGSCGQERVDAPICSKHPLDMLPGRERLFFDLDDEIEHGEPLSVSSTFFAQRGSHQFPVGKTLFEAIR